MDDVLLEASSFNLVKTGLILKYLYYTQGLSSSLSLSYLQGIDGLGAFHHTALNETYQSWQLNGSLTKSWPNLNYSGSFHFQYASQDQFSANQISMGGPYSVRGYKQEGLYGNTGGYWRNELALPFMLEEGVTCDFYVGLDLGWVKKEDSTQGGTLLGGATGLRIKSKAAVLDFYYSEPQRKEDVSEADTFIGISLSVVI